MNLLINITVGMGKTKILTYFGRITLSFLRMYSWKLNNWITFYVEKLRENCTSNYKNMKLIHLLLKYGARQTEYIIPSAGWSYNTLCKSSNTMAKRIIFDALD